MTLIHDDCVTGLYTPLDLILNITLHLVVLLLYTITMKDYVSVVVLPIFQAEEL